MNELNLDNWDYLDLLISENNDLSFNIKLDFIERDSEEEAQAITKILENSKKISGVFNKLREERLNNLKKDKKQFESLIKLIQALENSNMPQKDKRKFENIIEKF